MRCTRTAAALACLGAWAGCSFGSPPSANPGDAPPGDATGDAGDAAPDGPPTDGPSAQRCLTDSTYVDPGLGNGHRYKRLDADHDYDTATDRCAADGAHLAVVDNDAENTYLRGLHAAEMWIGYDDLTQEDSYRWVNGSTSSFEVFSGAEPNDNGVEDCTALRTSGTWHDVNCGDVRRPLCECDPAYQPPPTPACRTATTGFTMRNGRRYFPRLTPAKWQQARGDCASMGAHLVVISDDEENAAVEPLAVGAMWLGYTDAMNEGQFKWVNGAMSSFNRWPGGTVPTDDTMDCAVLQDVTGAWANVDCDDLNVYACECDPAPP